MNNNKYNVYKNIGGKGSLRLIRLLGIK